MGDACVGWRERRLFRPTAEAGTLPRRLQSRFQLDRDDVAPVVSNPNAGARPLLVVRLLNGEVVSADALSGCLEKRKVRDQRTVHRFDVVAVAGSEPRAGGCWRAGDCV